MGRFRAVGVADAIVFNPARYPELRAATDLFHPHRLCAASQVDHIIRILGSMHGHDDVALNSLPGRYWLIQQAIETVLVDVSCGRADWRPGTAVCQVYGPVERRPEIPTPLRAGQAASSVEQLRVCIALTSHRCSWDSPEGHLALFLPRVYGSMYGTKVPIVSHTC